MIVWLLFLVLAIASPVRAQSITEIYIESEKAKIVSLREELHKIAEHQPNTDEEIYRMGRILQEIKVIDRRIKTLEDDLRMKARQQ